MTMPPFGFLKGGESRQPLQGQGPMSHGPGSKIVATCLPIQSGLIKPGLEVRWHDISCLFSTFSTEMGSVHGFHLAANLGLWYMVEGTLRISSCLGPSVSEGLLSKGMVLHTSISMSVLCNMSLKGWNGARAEETLPSERFSEPLHGCASVFEGTRLLGGFKGKPMGTFWGPPF